MSLIQVIQQPRFRKIKTRIFALALLLFSCSMLTSAYRSISREFSGVIIRKTSNSGIASTHYQLHILPITSDLSNETITRAISDSDYPLQSVGVSAMAYEQAEPLESVEKGSLSMLMVGDGQCIDLGFSWLMFGIAGILISNLDAPADFESECVKENYSGEDLEIPGWINEPVFF